MTELLRIHDIESQSRRGRKGRRTKLSEVPENEAAMQYLFAIDFLKSNGFIQYEVSSFGKEGFSSRHNNAYWSGVPYLGVGPGAHSFNRVSRRFNVKNNAQYLRTISKKESSAETEILSKIQLVNEKIFTQLRTRTGLFIEEIEKDMSVHNVRMDQKYQFVLNQYIAMEQSINTLDQVKSLFI